MKGPGLAPYAKAIAGGIVGALTSAGTALTDGQLNASEIVAVCLGFMLGLGIVYGAPKNADGPPGA